MHDYEVEHQFPDIGRRIMLLNARKVFYENTPHATLLLGIEDVTGVPWSAKGRYCKGRAVAREGYVA
jgi:hypothetical protein